MRYIVLWDTFSGCWRAESDGIAAGNPKPIRGRPDPGVQSQHSGSRERDIDGFDGDVFRNEAGGKQGSDSLFLRAEA